MILVREESKFLSLYMYNLVNQQQRSSEAEATLIEADQIKSDEDLAQSLL